ncbi:fatty acid desaturase [Hansschlegelia sp. KR7-227]|uniref:fatty acid desaturase n=1 Tax=Hansschlegelia sp. KR7-227 TaxID=3400914 RepID=UPI003BFD6CE3
MRRALLDYQRPNVARSIYELALTAALFAAAWAAMWFAHSAGHDWLLVILVVPAAGFLLRLFSIQHDCGHGSLFANRAANDWIGRAIGVLTLTPYDCWRRSHAVHHATSGDLDHRGVGDIDTLTVAEYRGRTRWGRLRYRLYRNPVVMFGLGPAYVFILQSRLPIGLMGKGWTPWLSTMATNAAIALVVGVMIWAVGLGAFLLVHLPVVVIAGGLGVWLFFVQHQFEETHWSSGREWNALEAALHGSSHYDLPPVLTWFTANIGVHHVHHLSSRIPFYRLPEVLRDHPELREIGRLTLLQSLKCAPLALWDEAGRRLISFRQFSRDPAFAAA